MSIVQRVKTEIEKREKELKMDTKFQELQAFYQEMRSTGVAIKRPYDIPPLDTIGRTVFEAQELKVVR